MQNARKIVLQVPHEVSALQPELVFLFQIVRGAPLTHFISEKKNFFLCWSLICWENKRNTLLLTKSENGMNHLQSCNGIPFEFSLSNEKTSSPIMTLTFPPPPLHLTPFLIFFCKIILVIKVIKSQITGLKSGSSKHYRLRDQLRETTWPPSTGKLVAQ